MKNVLTKILLMVIGFAFVLYGTLIPLLPYIGEKTIGEVTDIRRELGERDETIRNQYSYAIGFEFKIEDGTTVYGNTKNIGDAINAGISLGETTVYYLKIFPNINALERDTVFSVGTLLIPAIGVVLIIVAFNVGKRKKRTKRKKPKKT